MNDTNTQKLYDAFPRLYRGRNLPHSKSSMLWGFECGDGWFNLIWNLSRAIEAEARRTGIDPKSILWPEATQVKNKFGTLRFHLRRDTEATQALKEDALKASEHIRDTPEASSIRDGHASKQ